ncbi:MAG: helix-turn-helix transcriptional regulator [Gemmatimonadaceae bacterium]
MEDRAGGSDRTLRLVLGGVLLATMIGGAVDLYLDSPETLWSPHVIYEVMLVAAAMIGFVYLWSGWWGARYELRVTRKLLGEQAAERDAWRSSAEVALAGLGQAIDGRFKAWGLTPVESEIALLLLKGRSHKEIAYTTSRSERTVRQHAVSIYQKSKLGGRAELAAFFLDGLLLPPVAPGTESAGLENAL